MSLHPYHTDDLCTRKTHIRCLSTHNARMMSACTSRTYSVCVRITRVLFVYMHHALTTSCRAFWSAKFCKNTYVNASRTHYTIQGVLECEILEAKNLPTKDLLGMPPDTYVQVSERERAKESRRVWEREERERTRARERERETNR